MKCCNSNMDKDDGDGVNEFAAERAEKNETGFNKPKPPEDDCCPICFGDFKVPCKANCGHWFCGSCILELWRHRSKPRKCRCPFCNSAICNLAPHLSTVDTAEDRVVEVLEDIELYNRYYVKGIQGFLQLMKFYLLQALREMFVGRLPFTKRVIVDLLTHPERVKHNYQEVRMLVSFLAIRLMFIAAIFLPDYMKFSMIIFKLREVISFILAYAPYVFMICVKWITLQWLRFSVWKMTRRRNAPIDEIERLTAASDHAVK